MTFLRSFNAPFSALWVGLALSVGCNDLLGLRESTLADGGDATEGGLGESSGGSTTGSSGAASGTSSSGGTRAGDAGASGNGSSGASSGGSGGDSSSGSGSTSSGNVSSGGATSGSSGASSGGSGSGASGLDGGSGSGASGSDGGSGSGASRSDAGSGSGSSGSDAGSGSGSSGSDAGSGSGSGGSDGGAIACMPPARGSLAFVQVATAKSAAAVPSIGATFPGVQTACNWIVLAIGWHDVSAAILNVTDSAGDTFKLGIGRGSVIAVGLSEALYYASAIRPTAANTVTVTFEPTAGMATAPNLRAVEYAGITDIDFINYTSGASVNGGVATPGPPVVNLTMFPELVFGAGIWDGTLTKGGSGFTVRNALGGDAIVEDLFTTKAGSFGPTETFTIPAGGGEFIVHVASFY